MNHCEISYDNRTVKVIDDQEEGALTLSEIITYLIVPTLKGFRFTDETINKFIDVEKAWAASLKGLKDESA